MKSNNRINVPEAKQGMDQFKMQAASEVGVNLKDGYNGDLTSREAGSIGGQMVKHFRGPLYDAYIQNPHHGVRKIIRHGSIKPGRSAPSFSRARMARLFDYESLRQAADQPALGLFCQCNHGEGPAVFSGPLCQRNADVLSGGGGAAE